MYKKALSPVVAIALLIVVSVVAVISFQSWINEFNSQHFANIENTKIETSAKILDIIGNKVYLSGEKLKIKSFKVTDSKGIEMCSYSNTSLSNGLQIYLDFEDYNSTHVYDKSGLSHHGVFSNYLENKIVYESSFDGKAAYFDGNISYIHLNDLQVNTTSGAKTVVSFYIKIDNWTANQWSMPFGWNTNYDLTLSSERYFGFNSGGGDLYGVEYEKHFKYNQPIYVVGVFSNNAINTGTRLFIDDKEYELRSLKGSHGNRTVTSYARIGGWRISAAYRFKGYIDEFRIHNNSLNRAEISLLAFNSMIDKQKSLDLSECDLVLGKKYEFIAITNQGVISYIFTNH